MNLTSTPSSRKAVGPDERVDESVSIEELVLDDERLQSRSGNLCEEAIDEYADGYAAKTKLPPIEVFKVDGKPYVVDGFHRIRARLKLKETFIRCTVVGKGSIEDAIWYAAGVNQGHGIRRTNEDKRKAIRLALDCGGDPSAREIARHCGVGDALVATVREEWQAERRQECEPNAADSGSPTPDQVHDRALGDLSPRNHTDLKTDDGPPERVQGKDGKWHPKRKAKKPEIATPMPEEAEQYRKAAAAVQRVRKEVRGLVEDQTAELSLEDAWRRLSDMTTARCDQCSGRGCKWCDSRGWSTKQDARATKEEIRSLKVSKTARGQA